MDFTTLQTTLEQYFETQWAARTPVTYENTKFDTSSTSWVRFTVKSDISKNAALGSSANRISGEIVVQVFTPLYRGTGAGNLIADDLITVLQNKNISGIFTYALTKVNVGNAQKQGYYQQNCSINFDAQ